MTMLYFVVVITLCITMQYVKHREVPTILSVCVGAYVSFVCPGHQIVNSEAALYVSSLLKMLRASLEHCTSMYHDSCQVVQLSQSSRPDLLCLL